MKELAMAAVVAAGAILACRPGPTGGSAGDSAVQGTPIPATAQRDTARRDGARHAGGTQGSVLLDSVTVREILGSSALVGRVVRVTGRCLGLRVPPVAEGGPPRTRSDWQLEAGGAAIYVTGPLPAGCTPEGGSAAAVTVTARVAEDTLPALGGQAGRTRRYLEIVG